MGFSEKIGNYFSLVKFSHTVFALPFAFVGFFMGVLTHKNPFHAELLIYVIICMITARNSAMGFNRLVDRRIDRINPRTAKREIPSGKVGVISAKWFVIINCGLFILTTYFINQITFFLSPVALLVVLGYSYTKRFTSLCHFVLGLGLSLAPIGAYLSVTGEFALSPVLLSILVLFWTGGFDIMYALQDEVFDKKLGLHSIPTKIGRKNSIVLSALIHLIPVGALVTVGLIENYGLYYLIGGSIFTGMLVYQHLIVKPNDLSRINLAFFTTNGVASIVFCVFFLLEVFINR